MSAEGVLQVRGVGKRFGATQALDQVNLDVRAGEVHALLGENGAGKSTLMKILAGAQSADQGDMLLDQRPFRPSGPKEARQAGVSIVYQELNLAPHLTVEENLLLGLEESRFGFLERRRSRRRVTEALQRLQRPDIQPKTPVHRLSPAARQLVEIARAFMTEARILILDEPTSSLGLNDIEHLFQVIDQLRNSGVAVIYISHFLEEVQRIGDRFTVLRDGRTVGEGRLQDFSMDQLVAQMIGRELQDMFPKVPHQVGNPILKLEAISGRPMPVNADLELKRGEVLGLAGLVGAGRTELLRTLFGLDPAGRGRLHISDKEYSLRHLAPSRLLQAGVGLLSEDRAQEGLALNRSVEENIHLSHLKPFTRGRFLSLPALARSAQNWIQTLGIRVQHPGQAVHALSGGNQQKVALARLLHHDVDVLLLDEPTRGVDVASKAQIYRLIGELAASGKAVLVVSSYTPELLGICDRIAVMHRGRVAAVKAAQAWDEHAILTVAASGKEEAA
ncbi:MAG: sugar ABC transporter ATP-binding protein [Planctomycetota bacterium]|nr:MAG: sugar ABC transporter ATP-binding protein [Planctomycetota bacterium]